MHYDIADRNILTGHVREEPPSSPSQRQAQLLQTQLSPQELIHQESLIQEREAEIREIETGIHELSEIFRDLGTLVQEQGGMLGGVRLFLFRHCSISRINRRQYRVEYIIDRCGHCRRSRGANNCS